MSNTEPELSIAAEIFMLKHGPNGNVSEPHHLKRLDENPYFSNRRVRRFVEANMDMIIHHFVKETADDSGLNALNDAQRERQDELVGLLSEYLLTVREQILKEKS